MASLNLEFETSSNYKGNVTAVKVSKYEYDKYGLQLYDDMAYNLNFQVFNIDNLEQRAATYSKTIKLPGTSINNNIFSNLYDIDVDVISDPSNPSLSDKVFFGKKINCELWYDTIPIKDGFFELKKVSYNESMRQIEYEGEFYSKSKSFSENVGDKLLTGNELIGEDLDFSMYDHKLTFENFVNSHSGTYYDNSVGYYYPIIDYINTEYNYAELESYRPALYVKEIIDKIFQKAGYTYSSTFFDSEFFSSLIIPWTGEVKIDSDDLELRNIRVGLEPTGYPTDYTGDGPILWGNTSWGAYRDFYNDSQKQGAPSVATTKHIPLDKDTPSPDWYNSTNEDYNTSTHKWNVPAKGKYRLNWTTTQNIYGIYWDGTGYAGLVYQQGDKMIDCRFMIMKENSAGELSMLTEVKSLKYMPHVAGDTWVTPWTETVMWSGELEEGDRIGCVASINNVNGWVDAGGMPKVVRVWMNVDAEGTAFSVVSEPGFQLYEDEIVEMRKALPEDQRQIDFFKDIVNMFNLVVDEYPNEDNKLYIETRDDYYESGTTLDWTGKEDISQAEEIERIPTLINKDFKLSYLSDKDDYNVLYEEENRNLIYGNHKVKNPYISNSTYDVKVNFSPTPLGLLSDQSNWGVSKIFKTNDRGEIQEQNFNTKILYRQNIDAFDVPQVPEGHLSPFGVVHTDNSIIEMFGFNPNSVLPYKYQPYAGHLDNPYAPTIDLNFGICNSYYYVHLPDVMTTNNVYNTYWKSYVAELMDLNSKRVTKYLKLEIDDIYNLSFASKIWIDGVLYVLEKINDWNPGQITKVELMKLSSYDLDTSTKTTTVKYKTNIKQKKKSKKKYPNVLNLQQPYSVDNTIYTGPSGEISGGTMSDWSGNTISTFKSPKNVFSDSAYGIIMGDNNRVESSGSVFIKGNKNTVKSGATNITILANDVTIADDVKDVVVLANDEPDKVITTSNLVYIPSGYTLENYYNKTEVVSEIDDKVSGITMSGVTREYADEHYRITGSTLEWGDVISTPKKIAGYGVTDVYNTGQTYTTTESETKFATKTGNFSYHQKTTQTLNAPDAYIIGDDYNGSGRVITLMTTYTTVGKVYLIQDEYGNAGTNNITIQTQGTQRINGGSSKVISTNYGTSFLYCDGSDWFGL